MEAGYGSEGSVVMVEKGKGEGKVVDVLLLLIKVESSIKVVKG